jgi:hypothetical protein
MNPYLVTRLHGDVEMADAEGSNNHDSSNDSSDDFSDDENTRDRILNFDFTARPLAFQGPQFALVLHHLREAFERDERRQIEFQLHHMMLLVFELDDTDPANISRDEWANLGFREEHIENLNVAGLANGVDATFRSLDGSHAVRVQLPLYAPPLDGFRRLVDAHAGLLVDAPAGPAIIIKYMGFLRFRTHSPAGRVVRSFIRDMQLWRLNRHAFY